MRLVEKTFSKNSLLCSMFYIFLQCSPGRSSPSFQLLVMNPGFFMPFRKVSKKKLHLILFFCISFQLQTSPSFRQMSKTTGGHHSAGIRPKGCGLLETALRSAELYFAASTRVLAAKYADALRTSPHGKGQAHGAGTDGRKQKRHPDEGMPHSVSIFRQPTGRRHFKTARADS